MCWTTRIRWIISVLFFLRLNLCHSQTWNDAIDNQTLSIGTIDKVQIVSLIIS